MLTVTPTSTGALPKREVPAVINLFREFEPFLPYTLLFGLPQDRPHTFPLWLNLLQTHLKPLAFFGDAEGDAARPAFAALESLALTTPPERIGILLMRETGGRWVYGWKQQAPTSKPGNVNGTAWSAKAVKSIWTWADLAQELQARQAQDTRSLRHGVILLYGLGNHLQQHEELQSLVAGLFQEGPRLALWPVVVDQYDALPFWTRFPLGPVVLCGTSKGLSPALISLFRARGHPRPQILFELKNDEALLLGRALHTRYQIPQPGLLNWARALRYVPLEREEREMARQEVAQRPRPSLPSERSILFSVSQSA